MASKETYSCSDCKYIDSIDVCRFCLKAVSHPLEKPSRWEPREGVIEPKDMVNHPQHYKSESGLEVIEAIEAFTYDLQGMEAVDTGNVLKYICRWKKKNGIEDLKKAQWYLNHLIKHVEKESN